MFQSKVNDEAQNTSAVMRLRDAVHRDKSPSRDDSPSRRATQSPETALMGEVIEERDATNAVNRSFGDLDTKKYLTYIGVLCALRMTIQHPLTIALARKQTCNYASEMSTRQLVSDIFSKEGGMKALTVGMPAYIVGTSLSEVICMGTYEYSRFAIPIEGEVTRDAVSGYLGDVSSRWIYTPMVCIANRQMTCNSESSIRARGATISEASSSLSATCKRMYTEGGVRPFFAAFGTSLVVGCSWTAVWLSLYSQCKNGLYAGLERFAPTSFTSNKSIPLWVRSTDDNFLINSVASGFTSGATAVMFNPFLVVRTRMQVKTGSTLVGTIGDVFREGGGRAFFKGTYLNVCACLFDGWLLSTTYEWAKLWSDRTKSA